MDINKVDIAMSMLEREAMNLVTKMGFGEHPLVQLGLRAGKQMYGDKLKAIVASVIQSDETMDAGKEVAKESFSSFLDSFQSKLKSKIDDAGGTDAQDSSEA